MRPRGLGATTIAMAVLNLGGFVGILWTLGVVAMVASVILLAYLVLWYYWQRRNWARLLVLFTSILPIVNLLIVSVLSSNRSPVQFVYPVPHRHCRERSTWFPFCCTGLTRRIFVPGFENLNQTPEYCSE
jgi:hypothetical protein